jgi:phytoene dehydrogenase-like protein
LRAKGKAGKLHLVLSQKPSFTGLDDSLLGERLVIAPGMDDIELAFNPSKYKRYPDSPILEIILPSVRDDSLCQNGQQLLSAVVQYLPYDDSTNEDQNRTAMLRVVIETLEEYAPGISDLIITAELLTPRDIEREFGISGGHWHHVELVFESFLFNRPTPLLTRHATPIDNLLLCGASCHPGGNLMGIAGRNAAQQVLRGEK